MCRTNPANNRFEDDPSLHRFTVVFDREGYSPIFLAAMKKKRIACLTYHKHPGEDWPRQEFFCAHSRPPGVRDKRPRCNSPSGEPGCQISCGCARSAS